MKICWVSLVWLASASGAASEPSLASLLGEASRCSDAVLRTTSNLCDPPERTAAMAVARCQSKWKIVAETAIGQPSPDASSATARERSRSLKLYLDAMEFEYIRVAELKVIELQKASGSCGFD